MSKKVPSRRIVELDLLRGFFIAVIILDHLQFWPSYLQYFTGQGRLWVSAAEGFFLISGLLIGYLRAYKGARTPLRVLSEHLVRRAGLLYLWCVGITFAVVSLTVAIPSESALLPRLPDADQVASLPVYLWNVVTMQFASDWIYFLRLYAFMLLATPIFLWLIRKGLWYVALALSLGLYAFSLLSGYNEAGLQWQVLFFGAGLIGWKFEIILQWLRKRPLLRREFMVLAIVATLSTMVMSYFFVHGWSFVESPTTTISRESYISIRSNVDPFFSNSPMVPSRIALSFVWFVGLLSLFHIARVFLQRYLGWLLLSYGTLSLSYYCLQAIILTIFVALVPPSNLPISNTVVGLGVLVGMWLLMRIPLLQKYLPK